MAFSAQHSGPTPVADMSKVHVANPDHEEEEGAEDEEE